MRVIFNDIACLLKKKVVFNASFKAQNHTSGLQEEQADTNGGGR